MKHILYISLIGLFILIGCSKQSTSPQQGAAIRIEFGDAIGNRSNCLFSNSADSVLAKSLSLESIDEVKVMILDFSAFDTSADYFASDDYAEYKIARDNWPGDLDKWGEWQKLLGDYFRIVADQNLNIEEEQAHGVVAGVIGLNYVYLMMLENGLRHTVYEGELKATEGETVTAHLRLVSGGY